MEKAMNVKSKLFKNEKDIDLKFKLNHCEYHT